MPSSSSSSTSTKHAFTTWDNHAKEIVTNLCIPPLSNASYKGSSGRVGVLGGSAQYTGAPYYAAMAALKAGSDLAFVFCADEAAIAIKCYSPELMVAPVYNAKYVNDFIINGKSNNRNERELLVDQMVQQVRSFLPKLHCLIIGPGLGRCPIVLEATSKIIRAALVEEVSLVIDADGLFLLSLDEYKDLLNCLNTSPNRAQVVLTPNEVEYRRLVETFCPSYILKSSSGDIFSGTPLQHCVVIRKGQHDHISIAIDTNSKLREFVCKEKGGLKRSGGIGDILAGTTGTFVAWNRILHEGFHSDGDLLLSCWSAACVTKRSTHRAFNRKRRAMTAPDILEDIGEVFDEMTR